nr:hypothetical protein Iba_chr11fCG7450 [Ipomoea batatas]
MISITLVMDGPICDWISWLLLFAADKLSLVALSGESPLLDSSGDPKETNSPTLGGAYDVSQSIELSLAPTNFRSEGDLCAKAILMSSRISLGFLCIVRDCSRSTSNAECSNRQSLTGACSLSAASTECPLGWDWTPSTAQSLCKVSDIKAEAQDSAQLALSSLPISDIDITECSWADCRCFSASTAKQFVGILLNCPSSCDDLETA